MSGDIIEQYESFMRSFSDQVNGAKGKRMRLRAPLNFRGVANLAQSFEATSVLEDSSDKKRIEEWNPLSQRPVHIKKPLRLEALGRDFDRVSSVFSEFINLAHELMHVLLWEPLFCGKLRPSKNQFVDLSLAFEGCCFWYADILLTPRLRLRYPDGEWIGARRSISQPNFHPYRAFHAMGLKDEDKIRNIYIDAFCGYRTRLLNSANIYTLNLSQRIYSFYGRSAWEVTKMYDVLRDIGFFSDYYERFCKIENLPSIFPKAILQTSPSKDVHGYCHLVFSQGLDHIHKLSPEKIEGVRIRRSAQMRAYYATTLLWIIKNNLIQNQKGGMSGQARHKLCKHLEKYLYFLEQALHALANTTPKEEIYETIRFADDFYSKNILTHFAYYKTWVNQRVTISNRFSKNQSAFGSGVNVEKWKTEDVDDLIKWLLLNPLSKLLKAPRGAQKSSSILVSQAYSLVFDLSNQTSDISKKTSDVAKRKKINNRLKKLLSNEVILREWSVKLGDIHPGRNKFREPIFIYE